MTAVAAIPWLDWALGISGAMALYSSLRFFFPGLAASPLRWSFVGLHRPWKSFPSPEGIRASAMSEEVCDNLLDEFLTDSGVGVLFFTEDARLCGLNASARRLLGNAKDVWIGQRATDILPMELAAIVLESWRDKLHAGTGAKAVALPHPAKDSVMGHTVLLHDRAGEFYGVALFVWKAAQTHGSSGKMEEPGLALDMEPDRLRQLASLGMHAAGMAHEIKNPMVALKTFAELLPSKYDDPEFRDHFSKLATNQIRRIDSIVNDLLYYARPRPPEWELANPLAILKEALDILAMQIKENKIRVGTFDVQGCPEVSMDSEQMRRVFLNILLNAMEAMPRGGDLSVLSYANLAKGYLEITVMDTGPGIPVKDLEHVFEPFYTTKKKGSGLGLAISKRIVEDHGGTIEFKNGKVGTMCVLMIPAKSFTPTRRVLSELSLREQRSNLVRSYRIASPLARNDTETKNES